MQRLHAYVEGKVQGVYFRATTRERAKELGLVGWVRNLPDGRVELVAVGDRAALDALAEFCHQGPPGARVTRVVTDVGEPDAGEEHPAFVIRR